MHRKKNFMSIIQRQAVLAFLACIFLITLVVSNEAKASETQSQTATDQAVALKSDDQETILAYAREFLNNRNQHLIAGTVVDEQIPSHISASLSARSVDDNTALHARITRLADLGETYSGFATDVRLVHARQVNGKLVACIEETTELYYVQVSGDEPPYTGFQVEREFVFKKNARNGWVIEDVIYRSEGLAPINEVVENDVAPAVRVQPLFPTSDASIDSSLSLLQARETTERPALALTYYDYSAMADYAIRYVYNYNPAYRSFPADCTNFISQAMYAGGWTMVTGYYTNNNVWWYNWLNQSYTWAGAHNWYFFARGSGRTSYLSNVWYMLIADVLQMDFTRDGQINHTMIVTVVGSSDLYLTYHSDNTLNRSLNSIILQYPNSWYYAHRT